MFLCDRCCVRQLMGSSYKKLFYKLICLFLFLIALPSYAGTLDDFENDATQSREASNDNGLPDSTSSKKDGDCDSLGDCIILGVLEGVWSISKLAGAMSMERMKPFPNDEKVIYRDFGESLLPIVRVDAYLHQASGNVSAKAIRVELGYGVFAFQFRRTVYEESNPKDKMTLTQLHGLYRMSFGNHVVMNWGLGTFELSGNETHKTLSMTFPVHVKVNSNWGWEVKPNYANFNGSTVWDVEGGILFTKKHLALNLGYRRLSSPEQIIHGPYVGASFFY